MYTVAVYLVDKAYGGPEEGGWWYDCGDPSDEHAEFTRGFANEEEAMIYCKGLNDQHEAKWNEGRRKLSSVLSEGIFVAEVRNGQPKPYPAEKPHYE